HCQKPHLGELRYSRGEGRVASSDPPFLQRPRSNAAPGGLATEEGPEKGAAPSTRSPDRTTRSNAESPRRRAATAAPQRPRSTAPRWSGARSRPRTTGRATSTSLLLGLGDHPGQLVQLGFGELAAFAIDQRCHCLRGRAVEKRLDQLAERPNPSPLAGKGGE